ncbi:sulfatase [Paenibacillus sp. CF384]|uniref:sulfatase n=1 Tax=Paenibacillus sp. CF384 TaxID=1884382 RepID=UPI00089D6118|nr:sulfatase [Paenibacillus sp. CF384]SDW46885.1 Arylsulfatase A [Paenibacillus sp. CF384]
MGVPKDKPNLLFILIDDMGWMDLGCYGSLFYETPNLDRLAAEGVRFTDAYAAAPVCSPTRASMMSGKYPAHVGVTNWIGGQTSGKLIDAPYIRHLPLQEKSVATALKEQGYQTWHVGKWHLGEREHYPDRHGFDVNIGGCSWGMPVNGFFSPYGIETLEEGPEGEYLTDRLTDEAIELIRQNEGAPFFLNLWHYAVHIPIEVSAELTKRFAEKAKALGLDRVEAFVEGEFFPCEHKKHLRVQRRIVQSDPAYAAMIYNLDWNIGRLVKALEETGQLDNTVIVFTSDNGGLATAEGSPTCNSPLQEGKGWMYEGGVREPLIIRWPGVAKPGSVSEVPVTSPDFYPTLLEMAGLDLLPEQHKDGVSLVPVLRGEESLSREAIFWHYPHYGNQGGTPGSSVREGDYKLIEFFEDGRLELYNLRTDLSEEHNIAELHPERTERLRQMLHEWREQIGAVIPEANPEGGVASIVK